METIDSQPRYTYEQILALFAETNAEIKSLSKRVGEITDTLGKYVEEQVRPKAIHEFKKYGIKLTESYQSVSNDEKGKNSYEIDLLLVNTHYAVAIESKSKLKIDDVNDHLERLEKIKRHPAKVLKNVELIGALAGMIVPKNVREYAIKKGLFVFVPSGDTVKLANEKTFKYKTWNTQK